MWKWKIIIHFERLCHDKSNALKTTTYGWILHQICHVIRSSCRKIATKGPKLYFCVLSSSIECWSRIWNSLIEGLINPRSNNHIVKNISQSRNELNRVNFLIEIGAQSSSYFTLPLRIDKNSGTWSNNNLHQAPIYLEPHPHLMIYKC